jgi:hypothetical protein
MPEPIEEAPPGVDFPKALKQFGNGDLWLDSVKTYVSCTPVLLAGLRRMNVEHLDQYRRTVRGLKGSSYAIAAEETGRMAEALEKAAYTGDLDFIRSNSEAFFGSMETLIARLQALVEKDGKMPLL